MATEAFTAPKASAAGAQPEPMTTATSCSDPRAAVRSAAATAASSAGSIPRAGSTLAPLSGRIGQVCRGGLSGGAKKLKADSGEAASEGAQHLQRGVSLGAGARAAGLF